MQERKIVRTIGLIFALLMVRLWLIQGELAAEEPALSVMSDAEPFPELYVVEDEQNDDQMEKNTETMQEVGKTVYLTFDDGPSKNTEKVLDVLKEYDIKATFFVIGKDLTENGIEQMKRAVEEGHVIGMHTYSHDYQCIYSSVNDFLADFNELRQTLTDILGVSPTIFRFPGGSYCSYGKTIRKDLIAEMTRRGYAYYDWNVSAEDSVGTVTAYSIKKNIFPRVYEVEEPIILMHDSIINNLTAQVLPDIIDQLIEEGYSFDTLKGREPLHFGEY